MEVQSKRGVFLFHIQSLPCLLDSALVLLVNVWGARQSGSSPDPSRAAADIQRCISCLKMYEPRLQLSGRFCDLLASISNQVLINPPSPTVPSLKRTRDLETQNHDVAVPTVLPLSSSSHSQRQQPPQPPQPPPPVERVISQYPLAAFPSHQTTQSLDVSDPYSMPISTEELGHLPLYPAFEHNWASDTSLTAMTEYRAHVQFCRCRGTGYG
ncbi:hypothetical protein C8F01DRAFT_725562 [Mycena amicta]|nr:hypothetical protein C8F01DRAFT_725562 [Mycena amicta]